MLKIMACVLATAAAFAVGCGGSDGDNGGSSTATADGSDKALAYSQCMRDNGVAEFPDPQNGKLLLKGGPDSGIDPSSPEFQSAAQACQDKAPSGGPGGKGMPADAQERFLKFADCMRSNGVPEFPDPEVTGGGVKMSLPQGLDPDSAEFKSAQQECAEVLGDLAQGAP